MKLSQRIFDGLARRLMNRADDKSLDDLLRIVQERAAAEGVLAHIVYVRGKDYVTLAQEVRQKAQPDVAWWRTASDTEKAEKRMELRAQFGRKGPPPPHRAPGDWQWRVHMERQALAKDRAELESLRTSAQRLGRVGDLRARIARHEHTLAQMRGQYLRPKKPKPIKWGPCQVCGEACDLEGGARLTQRATLPVALGWGIQQQEMRRCAA